jgi:hypothetical protein
MLWSLLCAGSIGPTARKGKSMHTWLEHDPVPLAILVFGIAAIELLAFSI